MFMKREHHGSFFDMEISMRTVSNNRLYPKPGRRGVILVFVMVCLVLFLGFTAFCVDIGSGALTQSALQNAADSASAAGAAALSQGYSAFTVASQNSSVGVISSSEATATNWCVTYARYNGATDVSSLKLAQNDVVFGFTDSTGVTSTDFSGYPNTVTVTIRRDGTSNPALGLSFAPIFGTSHLNLTATSSATIYTGLISSFNPRVGASGPISTRVAGRAPMEAGEVHTPTWEARTIALCCRSRST
jgi:Flp pilus assembly protein TadG